MIQIFQYENSPIQFEVIEGQLMANATLMAKAFLKKPDDVFKTKSWVEFEQAVCEDVKSNFEDIRRSKPGQPDNGGGTWIHEELVIEFARRLSAKFALWCNRKIAELSKTGFVAIRENLSPAEVLLQTVQQMVAQEHELREVRREQQELKSEVRQISAHMKARSDYFTVVGYASLHNIDVGLKLASSLGKKASAICKSRNVETEEIPDPRFGRVKTYPIAILEEVFNLNLA